jgi:hypothetical protein
MSLSKTNYGNTANGSQFPALNLVGLPLTWMSKKYVRKSKQPFVGTCSYRVYVRHHSVIAEALHANQPRYSSIRILDLPLLNGRWISFLERTPERNEHRKDKILCAGAQREPNFKFHARDKRPYTKPKTYKFETKFLVVRSISSYSSIWLITIKMKIVAVLYPGGDAAREEHRMLGEKNEYCWKSIVFLYMH